MNSIITKIIEDLISGWKSNKPFLKNVIIGAIISTVIAIIIVLIGELQNEDKSKLFEIIPAVLGTIAGLLAVSVSVYQELLRKEKQSEKIEHLVEELKANPKESLSAWELAKLNLQGYLDKNLRQVSAIFHLSVFVMLVGFSLIIYGVYRAFENPEMLNPSILVACSGLILNFIGATFLIIYRSTMNQAKNYVEVLERINAVGMSLQILESIDDSRSELKDTTTAEIAKELLNIYNQKDKDKSA
jgi:nitrate reductase gamma subunit